ncbi:MAG: hypothetical protein JWO80_2949 [Bryobacterales bacterium]|nr:hypothetical protein [Bryobacterales bacterium]
MRPVGQAEREVSPSDRGKNRRRVWTWIGISAFLALIVLAIVAEVVLSHAGPLLKGRVIETLSARFDGRVELDVLNASLLRGLEVSGDGLRIFPPDEVVAAGATQPVIAVDHFSFHSGVLGLFVKPMHVGTVHVTGLQIYVPPKDMRQHGPEHRRRGGKIKIVVDEIVCDNSRLIIGTNKPGKDPKDFELKHIELHEVGPNAPWRYGATLTNAIPRGDIQANGTFGPWNTESPGDSAVTGRYTFDHADLNTIKGIGGMLSSVGEFNGQLNRIVVDGTTETPDFSLDSAKHKIPLHTKFHAIVDGTSGDTYLQPVAAKLRETNFTCAGAVINVKGKGHAVDLDVDVPDGRIQDFLELAVKTEPPIMTGRIGMKAKMRIRPGKETVLHKLAVEGKFTLRRIHFTNPKVQDTVDMLSLRARGEPEEAKPGAEDVSSRMYGQFKLENGRLRFNNLVYSLPGATVRLAGVYSLDGDEFDFEGKVRTAAKLSKMVASWWKSLLLKPVDPFFAKNGAGAEIPVKISGTKSAPKFGLDLGGKGRGR